MQLHFRQNCIQTYVSCQGSKIVSILEVPPSARKGFYSFCHRRLSTMIRMNQLKTSILHCDYTPIRGQQVCGACGKFFSTDGKFFLTDGKFFSTEVHKKLLTRHKKFTVDNKKFTVGNKKFLSSNHDLSESYVSSVLVFTESNGVSFKHHH